MERAATEMAAVRGEVVLVEEMVSQEKIEELIKKQKLTLDDATDMHEEKVTYTLREKSPAAGGTVNG